MEVLTEAELEYLRKTSAVYLGVPQDVGVLVLRLVHEVKQHRANAQRSAFTTNAVAKLLSYSEEHVRAMCEMGRFPGAWRAGEGAHWRIPQEAIEAFKESCRPKVRRRVGG